MTYSKKDLLTNLFNSIQHIEEVINNQPITKGNFSTEEWLKVKMVTKELIKLRDGIEIMARIIKENYPL